MRSILNDAACTPCGAARRVALLHRWIACGALVAGAAPAALATGAPSTAPQVLIAITNSESMDGTTSGAIMVGSGGLGSADATLASSSSPVNYTVPPGFTPPLGGNGDGTARYTVTCNSTYQCDNSPSRLNMAKSAIRSVLSTYGTSLNFGLYTYSTGSPSKYTTWVYYMSPASSNFTFTNTPSATTVVNPCYNYASASSTVKSNCSAIAGLYPANVVSGNQYVNVGTTSDDALVNDVLYASFGTSAFTTYGTRTPANPYSSYTLATYTGNVGNYRVGYASTAPTVGSGGFTTTPTNAGYVPFSPQVMYAKRGWGYGASQSATTGAAAVAMGTDPASAAFTNALNAETNNASSSEIKSVAGQSAIYGLMNGARNYLGGLNLASCQKQYVILMTDGLPTMDSGGHAWPPLGTTTANAYALSASYAADGSFVSSTSQAVTDAIGAIKALGNAGIKVFVIGLGAGVDPSVNSSAASLLTAMAIAGGTTSYYAANDSTSLDNALNTIVDIIYNESAIAAPVAPISVSSGSSYEYKLSTISVPATGYVKAYPVTAAGVPSTTPSWDAAALMTPSQRQARLITPVADGSAMATLDAVDAAAYGLTPTTCVPDVGKIHSYVWNPAYAYNGCSYLDGRNASAPSLIGTFSSQDTGKWVGPPGSAQLTARDASYISYARGLSNRAPQLLFSNADGFIYSVHGTTGALQWGWTSRNVLAKLQYYATFLTSGYSDGGFTVVDAMDGSGAWGTYLVGSFQSGAEHFSVKLDGTLTPSSMVADTVVSNGSSPGDKAGTTGATPLRQPPIVAYVRSGGMDAAFHVYVVNVGSTSTLYEVNVATGASSSSVLPFTVTSALSLNANSNQLFMGTAAGEIWAITLATGDAAADANFRQKIGTLVNPSSGTALSNVLYVGYTDQDTAPYIYAMTASELEMFDVTSAGWTPLWASTPGQGYAYDATARAWATSGTVTRMTAGSVVSDLPLVVGHALLVPTWVAGSACSSGTGYYDFFDFGTGAFPANSGLLVNGSALASDMSLGAGAAFTTSVMIVSGGIVLNEGTQGSLPPDPTKNLKKSGNANAQPVSWRRSP